MGHLSLNSERTYKRLQERLDRTLTGAPYSPTFIKILEMLYTPKQAELARRLPDRPTPLPVLSQRLGIPADELEDQLNEMAYRGLVLDIQREETRYFALLPIVIGFFEYTYMRAPEGLDMKTLSELFTEYMGRDDRFVRSALQGETQLLRTMVQEEALPEDQERDNAIGKEAL